MIEHIWSVLCRHSVIDTESRNITLFEVIEQIGINTDAELPAIVPLQCQIVSLWKRSQEDKPLSADARLVIRTPKGEEIISNEIYKVDLSDAPRHRSRLNLTDLPVDGEGSLYFLIQLWQEEDWQTVARIPLQIQKVSNGEEDAETSD